jgi:hypothetical protein
VSEQQGDDRSFVVPWGDVGFKQRSSSGGGGGGGGGSSSSSSSKQHLMQHLQPLAETSQFVRL